MNTLALSIFPGVDLLGAAFDLEGWCVVRGPDPIFGGDIKTFHPPAGVFGLLLGGPPCQVFSRLRYVNPLAGQKHGNLIPEFERVVFEAQPDAFLMENVPEAPLPIVEGYVVRALILNNRWLGEEQNRARRFCFGTRDGRTLDVSPDMAVFEAPLMDMAVTASRSDPVPVRLQRAPGGGHAIKRRLRPPVVVAGHGNTPGQRPAGLGGTRTLAEMCRLQGLPEDFADELPFTVHGKRRAIGNGVPLPMGRAIAKAVRRAMSAPGRGAPHQEAAG